MSQYSELFWSIVSRIRTEYGEILSRYIQSGKIQTIITSNTDTFYAVTSPQAHQDLHLLADKSKIWSFVGYSKLMENKLRNGNLRILLVYWWMYLERLLLLQSKHLTQKMGETCSNFTIKRQLLYLSLHC